jgi:glutaminyl-tRNA synthetase
VAHRSLAVTHPIKVVIENLPDGHREEVQSSIHPKKPELGKRTLSFTKELYIEASDFMENPPADFFRLGPGKEVRLKNAYVIKCNQVIKNDKGEVTELRCTYDVATLGGKPTSDGRKVKGIVHWVSAVDCIDAEIRLYGRLFSVADPENVPDGKDFKSNLNPDSLKTIRTAKLEKSLADATPSTRYQFERVGYFCVDAKDSKPNALVFNQIVELSTGH